MLCSNSPGSRQGSFISRLPRGTIHACRLHIRPMQSLHAGIDTTATRNDVRLATPGPDCARAFPSSSGAADFMACDPAQMACREIPRDAGLFNGCGCRQRQECVCSCPLTVIESVDMAAVEVPLVGVTSAVNGNGPRAPSKDNVSVQVEDSVGEEQPAKPAFELEEHSIDQVRPIKVGLIGAGLTGITAGVLLPNKVPGLDLRIYDKNADVVSSVQQQHQSRWG